MNKVNSSERIVVFGFSLNLALPGEITAFSLGFSGIFTIPAKNLHNFFRN
jgi:hypothetical protein